MNDWEKWNKSVEHPLQAWEWGVFRDSTGVKVVREAGMQITLHQIPHTPYSVGYYPKGMLPLDALLARKLAKIAKEYNCILIKCEPKIEISDGVDSKSYKDMLKKFGCVAGKSLFTKYNFVLDVRPSEEQLLASFKQKTRYNIKVASKRGVKVELSIDPHDFDRYLELTEETTKRQGFYAHDSQYHKRMWEILGKAESSKQKAEQNSLTAHLLVAKYQGEVITTWVVFRFKDTLYYPYGASTREHREVMANNLVMWEAIKLAKQWGLSYLDMWGALGPNPDVSDPWYGFHNFKAGYNPRAVEYIGSYDYVAKPLLYQIYRLGEQLRWNYLRARKRLGR